MRIFRLLHQVTLRFSAMDESEAMSLNTEAEQAYNEALAKAKSKVIWNDERTKEIAANAGKPEYQAPKPQVLTVSDKLLLTSEKWYMRYGFAMVYIVAVPMIRNYMNGESEGDGSEVDEMEDFMRFYSNYKRFSKS